MLIPPVPGHAAIKDRAALAAYAQARAASSFGATDQAARNYAAALAGSPDNQILALRAFNEAVEAGNKPLALNAARRLENQGRLGPEVALLLLGEALKDKDRKRASALIGTIEKDKVFAFMGPLLRAWTEIGSRQRDAGALPLGAKIGGDSELLSASYALEHRPLLLLANSQYDLGTAELRKVAGGASMRDQRLRIAGAALLARKNKRRAALDLLAGEEPALVAARKLIEAGHPVPGEIGDARSGIGELLVRVAGDLHRQEVDPLSLRFARFATFFAPDNSEAWLVTSDLLNAAELRDGALAALKSIRADDPFAALAADTRIGLLVANGNQQAALQEAQAAVKAGATAGTWSRLGELYSELGRHSEAADAFGQALALSGTVDATPRWSLHLLHGGALDESGNWPASRAALEAAYKLAPKEPIVLNYLGYAQLERRENMKQAMALIAEASSLQPDNPEITDSLGWAHYLQGNLPKAIELLESAAAGQPSDPAINEHLGDAYYDAGRRYEARYAWKAAMIYAEEKDSARLRAKLEAGLKPETASP
ncbi:MAG: tetratricopeptide repeat protein [Sphingosinicella sp.]|nr:tetratricopeptide repeat protein [Sphingosinicella sp.]